MNTHREALEALVQNMPVYPSFTLLVLPEISGHLTERAISKPEVKNETKKESVIPVTRNKHTAQFKEQDLERAGRDGIPKVAQELGLAESMFCSWW